MATPGPALDSLIARKVWRAIVVSEAATGESYMVGQANGGKVPVPPFSTVLTEAHRVVEFFQNKGWSFRVKHIPDDDEYHGCFYRDDGRTYTFVKASEVPHVICLAALAALSNSNTL